MEIELIASGDELLNGTTADTNSVWLMTQLAALGLKTRRSTVVGDLTSDIVEALKTATARADVVVVSGGLGPTTDDLTLESAAAAAGVGLALHSATLEKIRTRMESRGFPFTANNQRQAMIPEGAIVLENRFGTAPMVEMRLQRATVFFLPGVPREFLGLCEEHLLPRIKAQAVAGGGPIRRVRVLRCYGITESSVDAALATLVERHPGISIGYRTTLPENHVRLTCLGPDADWVEATLERAAAEAQRLIGPGCFSRDGLSFSETLVALLRSARKTVAIAESLTGGLTAGLLSEAPGASEVLKGSLVTYTDSAKETLLGIPKPLLASNGAVSAPVAQSMAERARALLEADFGVACTGLAGPGGDAGGEPVGTVFTALAGPDGTAIRRHSFPGERDRVRRFAAYATLDPIRLSLSQGAAR
jgi:nicotinamide-nucleotide amidase